MAPRSEVAFHAQFSPDGRWVAYAARDRGSSDVFVQPFPPTGERWVVSNDGGEQPRWRGDGAELTYVSGNELLMSVGLATAPRFHADRSRRLFRRTMRPAGITFFRYAIRRDATRFLIDAARDAPRSATIDVLLNWRLSLRLIGALAD